MTYTKAVKLFKKSVILSGANDLITAKWTLPRRDKVLRSAQDDRFLKHKLINSFII